MGKIDIGASFGVRKEEIFLRVLSCLYINLKTMFLHEKKKKETKRNWQIGAMLIISLLALFNELTCLHFRTITCQ